MRQLTLRPSQQLTQESKAIKIEAPHQPTPIHSQAQRSTTQAAPPSSTITNPPPPIGTVPQLALNSGTSYPLIRTSTLDIDGNPIYPPKSKELLSIDIDADLAEEQKIWRNPGQDQSDYFNYGFDEFTWELYRQRQLAMANTLQQQKNDMQQMQQMVGGGGPMPGMPGMSMGGVQGGGGGGGGGQGPPMGPGGMPNMSPEDMVNMMTSQGVDPTQVGLEQFAQMMMMQGGMGGFGGPGGQQQGGGGFQQGNHQGGGGGGGGGRGRGRGRGGW